MRNISWLSLIGGLVALVAAIAHFGSLAYLIKAVPLYVIMAIGIALMVWDFLLSARETAEKREASAGRDQATPR